MKKVLRRSWVEISLSQVVENCQVYQAHSSTENIMAVVKADAYGHGAVEVSKILESIGVCNFAVSNIDEAIELRNAGIKGEVLILGYTPIEEVENLIRYDIVQTLLSSEYATQLINYGSKIKCQYAIDTGMNRIGLNADDVHMCEREIRRASKYLVLMGMYTHLCVADSDLQECNIFTEEQIQKFENVVTAVKDLDLPYIHCLNSAGGLWHRADAGEFSRVGIALYGLKPDYLNILPEGIKPAMEWKSVISMIKTVYAGETIGYGRTYLVEKDMRIATVSTGYADGYDRRLSNKGYVLINGKKAPIVGRICMDQFMIDVSEIECNIYDEVILLGNSGALSITADDMAHTIGTIGYEVVCSISKRVQRKYIY